MNPPHPAGAPVAEFAGRVLPHDLEAEQAVLGSLLIDPDAMASVRDKLEPTDFYSERHQHIYRAAVALDAQGEPIDTLTLRSHLERGGNLNRAGGLDYIAELSLVVPSSASVKHYADIVFEHALRRRLVAVGGEVTQLGFDTGASADEAIDVAEQRIFAVANAQRNDEASHIAPVVTETWGILQERLEAKKLVHGVPTNISGLDSVTQGLQRGELIILAARPSVGKTSFALNLGRNAAVVGKVPVAVFSLEMTKQSLVQRLICSEASVDSYLLSTGQADAAAFQRIARAMDTLVSAPMWIDDTPALSISSLRARARRLKTQHNIGLIIVDYLQLMRGGRTESRVQEVSDISSGLKSIAKELSIPVLALSQLSRESERGEGRKPQLSDLRDSGCLTGDSRVFVVEENRQVPIADLVGREGYSVLALDEAAWALTPRRVIRGFSSGVKDVFRLTLRSGRVVRASANHEFRTVTGWKRLDEIETGNLLAAPRTLPTGADARMSGSVPALPGHVGGDGCTLPGHSDHSPAAAPDLAAAGAASRPSAAGLGGPDDGPAPQASGVRRERLARLARGSSCPERADPADGDVIWDEVVSIEADGREETYDLTVAGLHNFVADGIVVHNSIEQDADVVLFIYRPGMQKDDVDKSVTELIVAKNRNGPTKTIDLHFVANQTTFREVDKVSSFD